MAKVRLGDYIKEYSVKNKLDEEIPVYSVTNDKGFCKNYFGKEVASQDKTTYKLVPRGYFAYNPSRINVGSVACQDKEDCVIVSPLYNVFKVASSIVQQYLLYYLKSDITMTYIREFATGSVRDNFKLSQLAELPFELRSIDKQNEIVKILDEIQQLIDTKKMELDKLNQLVKCRFVEMFGDPMVNPMGWDKKSLADECEIVTGNTPSRKIPEYYGSFIEWIKSDNINTPSAILTTAEEYLSEEGLAVGRYVESGSILMTCIAGSIGCIGNVAIADRKISFNQQINGIVPGKNNTWFMYVLFELSKKGIQSSINMSLKGILSKSQLSEMKFIFPPVELQNEFATFVQQVEKLKSDVQSSLDKTQVLMDSLMQQYFG